jgi:exopolyphosphatase / guanosine-5'-triphosphate,3'-diphosphate pyrophosphatase
VRTSVLDLGSNSFHVLVADAAADGTVVPRLREREMLHLGAVVARHGHLPDDARRLAVDTAAYLTELARRAGAEQRLAVATSALRDASNGPEVIAEMSVACETEVRVLDGLDEARLAYLGVRASVATTDEPILVLDLGGGSLELAVGTGPTVGWATSTDLGVSRLSTRLPDDPPRGKHVRKLAAHVAETLAPLRDTVAAHDPALVVAVGGTIRALARTVATKAHDWLPATLNQLVLRREALESLRDELLQLDTAGRAAMPGVKSRRADRIHVAAVIVCAALDALGLDELVVSDWGLREGTILDALGFSAVPSGPELRAREAARMRETFRPDRPHAPHVAHLTGRLFDGAREVHGLDDADRSLLLHAALVHDIGASLALRKHQRHSAYLLENAELRGFSPGELAQVITLTRFHTSRGIDTSFPPFAAMHADRRDRTRRMLALLQVADGLDRARDQSVEDLTVQVRGGAVRVVLHGRGLHVARTELERRAELFERTFGVPLELVDRVGADPRR